MELEGFELIVLIVAIAATGAAVIYGLARVDESDTVSRTDARADADAPYDRRAGDVEQGRGPDPAPSDAGIDAENAQSEHAASARIELPDASAPPPAPSPVAQPSPSPDAAPEASSPTAVPDLGPEPAAVAAPDEVPPPAVAETGGQGASAEAPPTAADDLTRIRGIGKSIEKKLNAMGVVSFAQIAAWTPDDLKRVDAALAFPGRAQRENWVGQAKAFLG
jgi:predicted flap endonuclease-1-like 5' DNA nuclease